MDAGAVDPTSPARPGDVAATQAAAACGRLLSEQGRHLVVAESCTGGLIGHWCTDVPGSSAWFLGGVIAYDDRIKTGLLSVPAALIREHGAVSSPCAAAMAEGVRRLLGGDIAVAVTGIAGPGGGTAAKPVGTVYIAVASGAGTRVVQHVWAGSRRSNKAASARAALDLVREILGAKTEITPEPTTERG